MKTDINSWLLRAHKEKFAIPSFDFGCVWDAAAIIQAAEEEKSPVVLMATILMSNIMGAKLTASTWKGLIDGTSVPVGLHLDHAFEYQDCEQAIKYGFDSVMIDASKYSLEENITRTRQVVSFAHKNGVYVEAEIGKIKGRTMENNYIGGDFLAQVDDAVELVKKTGVDSLAVGIGTAHGFYTEKPEINFMRLSEVNSALMMPLVLHGGTGIPSDDVQEAIRLGISKVNVGTEILTTYSNNIFDTIKKGGRSAIILTALHPAFEEVKEVARKWIRICMANDKVE